MVRQELKKRRIEPSAAFGSKFGAALGSLSAAFLASSSFQHALTKGIERERPVRELFETHLPACYKVVSGEAVDSRDHHSPQLDVMIFDGNRNFAFNSEESYLLPAEALLVSVEVKSKLTKPELEKSLNAASALYALRPFGKVPSLTKNGGNAIAPGFRFFHTVFAYDTDLVAGDDWLQRELTRTIEAAKSAKVDPDVVDRIYVAGRGFLNVPSNLGVPETSASGIALMHFFMDVLNFLVRENGRRSAVEYTSYAGRMTKEIAALER
jgi:hypothetical protein